MFASDITYLNQHQDLLRSKRASGRELYELLLEELQQFGPVREIKKMTSIALENRKAFGSVIIRERSIKLKFKCSYKITDPRILRAEPVAKKTYEHTLTLSSKDEIDEQLLTWLGEAYEFGK